MTKWTTQEDGVAYPNTLYFFLGQKEANTSLIVSQLSAIQFRQINTGLQYVHTEGGFFLPRVEEGGKKDDVRENVSEEDPPLWVCVK